MISLYIVTIALLGLGKHIWQGARGKVLPPETLASKSLKDPGQPPK
jgi:hypothetical protein